MLTTKLFKPYYGRSKEAILHSKDEVIEEMTKPRTAFAVITLIAILSVAINAWLLSDSRVLFAKMHGTDVDQTMTQRNAYDHNFKLGLNQAEAK